jgi:hypothetical protein
MRPLWRATSVVLLFNGLLVAVVLFKPGTDAMLALVVNSAEFIGPLLVVPLCFAGVLTNYLKRDRRCWRRYHSKMQATLISPR